jgi:hypothetical protein
MKFASGSNIGLMRFFRRTEQTYAYRFVIDLYFGQPFAVFSTNATKTAFAYSNPFVLRVLRVCDFTQIYKPVIRSIAVYVVNLIDWPLTVRIEPRQSMRQIQNIIKPNAYVTVFHSTADYISKSTPAPCFGPRKQPGIRIVMEKFVQSLKCHAVNINPVLCGGQA